MTSASSQSTRRDDLLKRIDQLLWQDAYAADIRSTAVIGLGLGEFLRDSLDDVQRSALDAARAYWHGGGEDEKDRLAFVEKIGMRRDKDARDGKSRTREGYANQIVWTALNANTGLSGFAGEFLVEIGEGAGLSIEQIESAFRKVLPALPRNS